MKRTERLYLHEEVTLLALKDETGTIAHASSYPFAVGGAVLAELLLDGRIEIDQRSKSKLVEARSAKPPGDPLLDECLKRIRTARRRASLSTWVGRIANTKRVKHRIAHGLYERGILREEQARVLLVFERTVYPELDPEPERALIERLRTAISTDAGDVDPRTAILIALAHPTGLLKPVLGAKELRRRGKRIRDITSGEVVGKATEEAIQAVQAMLYFTAVYLPMMAS